MTLRAGLLPTALVLIILSIGTSANLQARLFQRDVEAYVNSHRAAILEEFRELLSIPNVTSDRANVRRNAIVLQRLMAARGFTTDLLETSGNPLVFGERRTPGATRTILVYCQYDGQPVGAARWQQANPFEPALRTGRLDDGGQEVPWTKASDAQGQWRIYARSAADAKGPIIGFLAALDALQFLKIMPTANLRVIMDGDEELGSPYLREALERNSDRLRADVLIVLDGPRHASSRPTLAFGARGMLTARLTVYGPQVSLHSGNYGNWVPNPALALSHLLASMKDQSGRVLIQDFNEGIEPLSAEESEMLDAVPDDTEKLLSAFGIAAPERAQSLQASLQYPTLNIHGLASAEIGEQARTIIPDRAVAELDLRLVKETPARRMTTLLRRHIAAQGYVLVDTEPDGVERAKYSRLARLAITSSEEAFRTAASALESRRLSRRLQNVWGVPAVRIRTIGGTVPVARFIDALGIPAVILPIANFDNNQHAEDENLTIESLFQGIVSIAAALTS